MPLFGKKEKKIDLPEVVDFSNDTWSYKGNPPVYQIQSDGFTYDIVDMINKPFNEKSVKSVIEKTLIYKENRD